MAFELSKYAKGLSAILGLKERGVGIPVLSDQCVGVIDVRELYLLNDREDVSQFALAVGAVGINYFTTLEVPPKEVWYCWEYTVSSAPGAGAAIDLAPAYNPDGLTALANRAPYQAAAATQNVAVSSPSPFWAGAGTKFGANVRSFTLAPTLNAQLVITRLRV